MKKTAKRIRSTCLTALLGAAAMLGTAQPAPVQPAPATTASSSLDGQWLARVRVPNGRQYEANLELTGAEGMWQLTVRSGSDPCVGLPVPVSWRATGTGIDLTLQTSRALRGCQDSTIAFSRVDERTFQGRSPAGVDMTLSRK